MIADSHALIKIFASVIENHVCSATGTSQITTVVDGKYDPIYGVRSVINSAFQTIAGDQMTGFVITVFVGAVNDTGLYFSGSGTLHDCCQTVEFQNVPHTYGQPSLTSAYIAIAPTVNGHRVEWMITVFASESQIFIECHSMSCKTIHVFKNHIRCGQWSPGHGFQISYID
jgi:hypothetical protein